MSKARAAKSGQAMIETIIVMFCVCLVFFAVYEYANLLTIRTVLDYAAARAARARAVGFNDFMITKTVRVATMSVAGQCRTCGTDGGRLSTAGLVSRMGDYLECEYESEARGTLDFELWDGDKLGWTCIETGGNISQLKMNVRQRHPLYGSVDDDTASSCHVINGHAEIESHSPFYLQ